jgi:hypothetical protein
MNNVLQENLNMCAENERIPTAVSVGRARKRDCRFGMTIQTEGVNSYQRDTRTRVVPAGHAVA